MTKRVGIVDLFSGPGGLAEGFCPWNADADWPFSIAISVEKEPYAHRTLMLRSFLRKFNGRLPVEYYEFLHGKIAEPDWEDAYPDEWQAAANEAQCRELGKTGTTRFLNNRIADIRNDYGDRTVLIGGPPCQAYSLAGRVRNAAIAGYVPHEDKRNRLYVQYIKVLAALEPAIFIMENVKGMLSAAVEGRGIFEKVLRDLKSACPRGYQLVPLSSHGEAAIGKQLPLPADFIVRAEDHGIPQARHRIFIVGLRSDVAERLPRDIWPFLERSSSPSIGAMIGAMPRLRSGISRGDDHQAWLSAVLGAVRFVRQHAPKYRPPNQQRFRATLAQCAAELADMSPMPRVGKNGNRGLPSKKCPPDLRQWLVDCKLRRLPNNETRSHMSSDLVRYLFASSYGRVFGRSPKASEFPAELAPRHRNWRSGAFSDRFRVQIEHRPATTITSHISKDGHYYIHPDPAQCRSLTVREAARLQTFPDNYYFCGNRTQQYVQVGNAVPPFLAHQIARSVVCMFRFLENAEKLKRTHQPSKALRASA